MVDVNITLESYDWNPDGTLRLNVTYYVPGKKTWTRTFTYTAPFDRNAIIQEVRDFAHDIIGIRDQVIALNLEEFIGVQFTETVP